MPLLASNLTDLDTLSMLLKVMLMASLVSVACALVGSFLLLRRMSMMGDALSHAVLPGLVVAFVLSGSLSIVPLFAGAVVAGLATTFLTQSLHRYGGIATDAAMGVVFTSLFALGVVLLKVFASDLHFDASCVYEGSLLWLVLDTTSVLGVEVPRQAFVVLPILLFNLAVIGLLWKELQLTTFDSALATSMGFSSTTLHYLLMALVALTAVASFQVVGSILVVAMLIIPPAAAQLLVVRLHRMVLVACAIAVLVAVVGSTLSIVFDVSPPGMMAMVAGCVYLLAALFSPHGGVLSKVWFNLQTSLRIVREDLLSMLYRVEEHEPERRLSALQARQAVGGGWASGRALRTLIARGDILPSVEGLALSDAGRQRARKLVRTHRLWETYLVDELGLALDHVHDPAHRVEHFLGDEIREQLAERLPEGAEDPHGREIPE